jgi:hypothetical protein
MESELAFAQYAVQLCSMQSDLTLKTQIEVGGLVVYAVIRAASKYAHQGRVDGKQVAMKVTRLDDSDEYAFHLENGNRYRREDLTFYVRSPEGKFIKLR